MHNGNLEWKVLTRHINQQLEGKKVDAGKEAPRSECLEDRCGEDERWWMWGRTGHYFCHSLLICSLSSFFFTPTPLSRYRLTLSHSSHPPLALHPFWTDGVFSNPTFYPIISLAGLRGCCSQYLSPPRWTSFDQGGSSRGLAAAAAAAAALNPARPITRGDPFPTLDKRWLKDINLATLYVQVCRMLTYLKYTSVKETLQGRGAFPQRIPATRRK